MGSYAELAERLVTALGLSTVPVAVTFSDDPPAGVAEPPTTVAAGCEFWELGASDALVTRAVHHQFCSIGIHTHNLADAPPRQGEELTATLAAMQGLDYVRPEEIQSLPVMQSAQPFVVYAPLAECDGEPSAVLLFVHAAQGLVITEAVARVDGGIPAVLGRPACALIPYVVNSARSASSLGCCGARAYLDVLDDGTTIWALHGGNLGAYTEAIETLAGANDTLRRFHELRRIDIVAGKTPSVEESLARLSHPE